MVKLDISILRTSYDVETGGVLSKRVITDSTGVERIADIPNAVFGTLVEMDSKENGSSSKRKKIEVTHSVLSIAAESTDVRSEYNMYLRREVQ